ncbi:MAG: universal stress protein [Dehalogenimonas sp.]
MYERILVPLDGSKLAETVLTNVEDIMVKMAPETESEVTLLEVVSGLTYNALTRDRRAQVPLEEHELEEVKAEALAYLEETAAPLRARGIKVNTMVSVGDVAEEVVKAAHEVKANIIAMSTHGFSGIKRWALGSIADRVVKISDIPTMVIRAKG